MPQEVGISSEYLSQICLNLTNRLSAEELHKLYSLLRVDYDDFPAQDQAEKVRKLVAYLQPRSRIHELVQIASQLRPDISWGDMPQPTERAQRAVSTMPSPLPPSPPGTVFVLPAADQYGGLKLRPVRDMNVAGQAIFSGRPLTVVEGPITEGDTSWVLVHTQSADDIVGWTCVQSGGEAYIGDRPGATTPTTMSPITPPTHVVYVQPDADKYGGLKLRPVRDTNVAGLAMPSGTALNVVAEPIGTAPHEWLLVTAQDGKDTAGWVHTRQAGEVYVSDTPAGGAPRLVFALPEVADLWVIAPEGLWFRTHPDMPAGPGSPTALFGQHLTALDSESAPDDKGRTWIQIRTDDGLVAWAPASENGEPYLSNIQPYRAEVLDTQSVRDAGGLRIRDQRSIYATVVDMLQIGQQFDVYYRTVESDGTPWLWVKSPNNKYGWTREKSGDVTLVGEAGEVSRPEPTEVPMPETPPADKPEPAPPSPDLGGTMTGTNQDIINAFFSAASEVSQDGWTWLTRSGLSHLAEARSAPYTGQAIDLLPDLTDDEKARIKAKLPKQPEVGELAAGTMPYVQPDVTPHGGLKVRVAHKPDANFVETLQAGTQVTVLEGPVTDGGETWVHIRTASGNEGWARPSGEGETYLAPAPPAMPSPPALKLSERADEIRPGQSFGAAGRPARTITAIVADRDDSSTLMLLLPGDILSVRLDVIQPDPGHGGAEEDKIGAVERRVFQETCVAAVAPLEGPRPFLSMLPDGQPVAGVVSPSMGLAIRKFGGETGETVGEIAELGASLTLTSSGQSVTLRDLFIVRQSGFAGQGDIGALVVTKDNHAVGMIVDQNEDRTFCLPIQPALNQLNVRPVQGRYHYTVTHETAEQLKAKTDSIGGQDRLGFAQYVQAFVRLIDDTDPPLTIGIYGAWGSGKSFLMDKIAQELRGLSRPSERGKLPGIKPFTPPTDIKRIERRGFLEKLLNPLSTKMLTVWFDAWDYNCSDKLWAGLAERIFLSIENSGLGWYGQIRVNLKRNLEREWRRLRARLLPYTLIAIVVGALTVGLVRSNQVVWATVVGGPMALVLLDKLIGLFANPASQRVVDLFASPDYQSDLGFMGRIRQDLEDFASNLPMGMKVVVFIDDLDRCDPKKAVEVLEAVKLLLDFDRFIVFLALDARIITQVIEEHYGKVLVEAEITGYEYLDKIVQIPFSIPETLPRELLNYFGSLLDMDEADIPLEQVIAARLRKAETRRQITVQAVETAPTPKEAEPPPSLPPTADELRPPQPGPIVPPGSTELPPAGTQIEEMRLTARMTFTPAEREVLLPFYLHLDPNPRRIKRLVNIYRLVRALIESRKQAPGADQALSSFGPPEGRRLIMGWLILCEQWPYAAHMLLEEFDRQSSKLSGRLSDIPVAALYEAAKRRIAQEDNKTLKRLDLKHDLLESFITVHLSKFTLEDMRRLRPFTVNFNPALSAEVRLTLSSERS